MRRRSALWGRQCRSHINQRQAAQRRRAASRVALLLLLSFWPAGVEPAANGSLASSPAGADKQPAAAQQQHHHQATGDGGDLLSKHLTHSSEFDWRRPADGKPPKWLTDYVEFHRRTRGTPDAKYIINSCHHSYSCDYGVGDRVRGLLPTIQLAIAHKRVLLIHWASPTPLEHFFQPAQINWTVTPDLGVDAGGGAQVATCCDRERFDAHAPPYGGAKSWTLATNSLHFFKHLPPGVPTFRRVSWDTHSLLKALFQPSPALVEATNAEQLKLLGSLDRPFVAVHLRMGHLEGEAADVNRGWDHFHGFLAAYQCAVRRQRLLALLSGRQERDGDGPASQEEPAGRPADGDAGQERGRAPAVAQGNATRHQHHHHRHAHQAQHHHHSAPSPQQRRLLVAGGHHGGKAHQRHAAADAVAALSGWLRGVSVQADRWWREAFEARGDDGSGDARRRHKPEQAAGAGDANREGRRQEGEARSAREEDGEGGWLSPSWHEALGRMPEVDPRGAKVLLLTDHSRLRRAIARGATPGAVGPDYLAHHISGVTLQHAQRAAGTGSVDNGTAAAAAAAGARSEGGGGALAAGRRPTEAEEHERASLTVYVDLMLLARAHCLVWSKSGFSMVAMMLGFNPCTVDVPTCMEENDKAQRADAEAPPVSGTGAAAG